MLIFSERRNWWLVVEDTAMNWESRSWSVLLQSQLHSPITLGSYVLFQKTEFNGFLYTQHFALSYIKPYTRGSRRLDTVSPPHQKSLDHNTEPAIFLRSLVEICKTAEKEFCIVFWIGLSQRQSFMRWGNHRKHWLKKIIIKKPLLFSCQKSHSNSLEECCRTDCNSPAQCLPGSCEIGDSCFCPKEYPPQDEPRGFSRVELDVIRHLKLLPCLSI